MSLEGLRAVEPKPERSTPPLETDTPALRELPTKAASRLAGSRVPEPLHDQP